MLIPLSLSLSLSLSRLATAANLFCLLILTCLASLAFAPTPNVNAVPLKTTATPSLQLSVNKTSLAINGLPSDTAQIGSLNITTTTENPTGYTTSISTNSPTETCLMRPSDMTNGKTCASSNVPVIKPVAGSVDNSGTITPSQLTPNQWGASLATTFSTDPGQDNTWFQISNNSSPSVIKNSASQASAGDIQTLTVGVKVGLTLPPTTVGDEYQNTLVVTATVNIGTLLAPTITSLSPNSSTVAENKAITINGANLDTAYQVFVDFNANGNQDTGEQCTSANIVSNAQITCNMPTASAVGTYDVVVKTWGGTAKASFTFKNSLPAVPTLSPASNALVDPGTTAITVTSSGATCTWGTNAATATANASGVTHTTAAGTNTLYYSCIAGTGGTASEARTGNWSYLGAIMQNITKANCPTTIKAVIDNRDRHYYYVQKMDDGNCWMLTNLAYSGAAAGIQFISGSGSFDSDPCVLSSTVWCAHTSPADNARQWVDPTSSDITGDHCATAYRASATALNYTECGYFYNWCAALGNAYNSCDAYTALSAPANAGVGLCPSGWRLPTGGSPGEYAILNVKMVDPSYSPHIPPLEDEINSPLYYSNWSPTSKWHGVYGGLFYPGSGLVNNGLAGYYWTATIYARPMAYGHRIMTNQVSAGWMETMKSWGYAVRCVAV